MLLLNFLVGDLSGVYFIYVLSVSFSKQWFTLNFYAGLTVYGFFILKSRTSPITMMFLFPISTFIQSNNNTKKNVEQAVQSNNLIYCEAFLTHISNHNSQYKYLIRIDILGNLT